MRPARPLALCVLFITVAVVGCDCESMLATRRREGAPTTSEGRSWEEAPAQAVDRATPPGPAPSRRQVEAPPKAGKLEAAKLKAAKIEAAQIKAAQIKAEPDEAGSTAPDLRKLQPPRATARGGLEGIKPIKLPRNMMPLARFGGDPAPKQEAEPLESDDR